MTCHRSAQIGEQTCLPRDLDLIDALGFVRPQELVAGFQVDDVLAKELAARIASVSTFFSTGNMHGVIVETANDQTWRDQGNGNGNGNGNIPERTIGTELKGGLAGRYSG